MWTRITVVVLTLLFSAGSTRAEVEVLVTASTPHVADGVDSSAVIVQVTDSGVPVTDADVVLEVAAPTFVTQLSHVVLKIAATNDGGGFYSASFASPVAGPVRILARDRSSLSTDTFIVEFLEPPAPLAAAALDQRFIPLKNDPDPNPRTNCKNFYRRLDDEFYPPLLQKAIDAETDATKKAELQQRMTDLLAIVEDVLDKDIEHQSKEAKGTPPTQSAKDALAAKKLANSAAIMRISAKVKEIIEEFFGDPVDAAKFQACTELFNNFDLVWDFDMAVERIESGRTGPGGKIVEDGPDAAIAHLRWATFAKIAIALGHDKDCWAKLLPVLAKGSQITIEVLKDHDATRPGTQARRLTAEEIKKLREVYDALLPQDSDTDEQKEQKRRNAEKKVQDSVGEVLSANLIGPELPGTGQQTMLAFVESADCFTGDPSALNVELFSSFTLTRSGQDLFGHGVDDAGHTYVILGQVEISTYRFTIAGHGMTPGIKPAIGAFTGRVAGNQLIGTFEGVGLGFLNGIQDAECVYSGSFWATGDFGSLIFTDGFESGDVSAWSSSRP